MMWNRRIFFTHLLMLILVLFIFCDDLALGFSPSIKNRNPEFQLFFTEQIFSANAVTLQRVIARVFRLLRLLLFAIVLISLISLLSRNFSALTYSFVSFRTSINRIVTLIAFNLGKRAPPAFI